MEYFAVTILVLIFIGLTHFHNWVLRVLHEDNEAEGAVVGVTIIIIIFYVILLKYIIKWGINLI